MGNNNNNDTTGQINTGNANTDFNNRDECPSDERPMLVQNSTSEHVRMAVTGHFTAGEIAEAKHALWSLCGGDVMGIDMPRRRESTTRPLAEANTHDIITALGKLNKAEILPNVMIDAYSLGKIPRWHPEELNQMSLADRMLRLENRVTGLQEVVDRHTAENIVTKEILDRDMSFASAVKRGQSRSPTPQSVSPPGRANNDPPSVDGSGGENTSVADEDSVNASQAVLDKQDSKTCKNPDAPFSATFPSPTKT